MTRAERRKWLKANGIGILQSIDELTQLHEYITSIRKDDRPWRSLVEIGVRMGGSLFMLAGYLEPGATIIGIDPTKKPGCLRRMKLVVRELKQQGFDIHMLHCTSEAARKQVTPLLAKMAGAIDYLHIDGAHAYEDVRNDFNWYGPLVPSGGVIQQHDVVNAYPSTGEEYGSKRFWSEIAPQYPEHVTLTSAKNERVPGIGVIHVR